MQAAYSLLSLLTAPVVIGSPLSKKLAMASKAWRFMSVHSTSSSVWQENKDHLCQSTKISWELKHRDTDCTTTFNYFSNCDEVRAKEHTFHSFDFKEVPGRKTVSYLTKLKNKLVLLMYCLLSRMAQKVTLLLTLSRQNVSANKTHIFQHTLILETQDYLSCSILWVHLSNLLYLLKQLLSEKRK